MSDAQTQTSSRSTYTVDIPNEKSWQDLIRIAFIERAGLSNTLEKIFDVTFIRDGKNLHLPPISFVQLVGTKDGFHHIQNALATMKHDLDQGIHLTKETIRNIGRTFDVLSPESAAKEFNFVAEQPKPANGNHKKSYTFTPKTDGQAKMDDMVENHDVTFGVGPAGTGKTHVAIAKAAEALSAGTVDKVFLSRAAIPSGVPLGALPGGVEEKLAPYMRPLYDELKKIMGYERLKKLMEKEIIEIAPVELMRGRTFENAFIILDEAQNTTKDQIKMALTRMGEGSKMIVTGDPTQIDLKPKSESGLQYALDTLKDVKGIGIQLFTSADVVRHPAVKRIVEAFEKAEKAAEMQTPQPAALRRSL